MANSISIISLIKILWLRRQRYSIISLIFVLLGLLIVSFIPRKYKCESTIRILAKSEYDPYYIYFNRSSIQELEGLDAASLKILVTSSDFLKEVVSKANLVNYYASEGNGEEVRINSAIEKLRLNLYVKELQTNKDILQIRVNDDDKYKSIEIVKGILETIQEKLNSEVNQKNSMFAKSIGESIDFQKRKMDSLKSKLSELRSKYKIVSDKRSVGTSQLINKSEGYYLNYDQVMDFENQLEEYTKYLAADLDLYSKLVFFRNSDYPVIEILEEPYLPYSANNFNLTFVRVFVIILALFCSTIVTLIQHFFFDK